MGILLGGPLIEISTNNAAQKAVSIFKDKFTFTIFEIAEAYQKSYNYALAAIIASLAEPDETSQFLKQLIQSQVPGEFPDKIKSVYLQSFAAEHELYPLTLRQTLIADLQELLEQPPIFTGEKCYLTESELAIFLKDEGTEAITDFILGKRTDPFLDEKLVIFLDKKDEGTEAITDLILAECPEPLDDLLIRFLRRNDLLVRTILFFFNEIINKEPRFKTTLDKLETECLLVQVDNIKTRQDQLLERLQTEYKQHYALAIEAMKDNDFSAVQKLSDKLKKLQNSLDVISEHLQAAITAWESYHQPFLEFYDHFKNWAYLLEAKPNQVLAEVKKLRGPIINIEESIDTLFNKFRAFEHSLELSTQINYLYKFTDHTPETLVQIKKALSRLKCLPVPNYKLMLLAGTVVYSTGELAEAEALFVEVIDGTENQAEKALAFFNLFQLQIQQQAYTEALTNLHAAIELEPNYMLHDVGKYPIKSLLSAGNLGYVFLCKNIDNKNQNVIVKCFGNLKLPRNIVFDDIIMMRDNASYYVPKLLNWGYVDAAQQNKPYLVIEYIEGALDGNSWLEKRGKLDLAAGIDVSIQIAKCLQIAHKLGIFHFDLKPANLLLKRTKLGLISVKIINFGVAKVSTFLKGGKIEDQLNAKNDIYAFGATLYCLMTNENPENLDTNGSLAKEEPALFQIFSACQDTEHCPTAQEIVKKLEKIRDIRFKLLMKNPIQQTVKKSFKLVALKKSFKDSSVSLKTFKRLFLLMCIVVIVVCAIIFFSPYKEEPSTEISASQNTKVTPSPAKRRIRNKIFRDILKDGSQGPEMRIINSGFFSMGDIQGGGDNNEQPVHKVSVDRFAMGRYEVTFADYDKFAEATGRDKPSDEGWGRGQRPVINVSWDDAIAYTEWLSKQTQQQYRLPTEAEWEYAARAGSSTKRYWGNKADKACTYANVHDITSKKENGFSWTNHNCNDGYAQTAPVGQFKPNAFGLFDMLGNVWEWTCSKYTDKYYDNSEKLCLGKSNPAEFYVLRGSAWNLNPWNVRIAVRSKNSHVSHNKFVGFRLVSIVYR
jgi:formylglycine-generating enzyme required for sulfatase activity